MTVNNFRAKHSDKSSAGFTIIEVLIVLAIAGLIMVIVFLAVPMLQMHQRNSARQQDASRLAGVINEYISEDGIVQPGMEGGTENETDWDNIDCPHIAADVGRLAEFGTSGNISSMCTADSTQATTNNDFVMYVLNSTNNHLGLGNNTGTNWLVYITGAVCPSAQAPILDIPNGNVHQSVLIYPWEKFGPDDLRCLQVT